MKSIARPAAGHGKRVRGRIAAVSRLLWPLVLGFAFALAQAQTSTEEPPLEENKLGILIFAVLFVAFCVGIVWYIWRAEKKKQGQQTKQ